MRQEVLGNERDVVSALRQGLAERIGRDRFDLWFGSHVRWELLDGAVRLTAPNSFLLDRLRRQFAEDVQFAVHSICGLCTVAEFHVAEPSSSASTPVATAVATPPRLAGSTDDAASVAVVSPRVQSVPSPSQPGRRSPATLESFVVGEGNRLAATAVRSVIQRPGVMVPLFLYGSPGTGKSHLLEAVCHHTRSQGRARALLLSAEQFTCLFLEALQGSGLPNFRRKCRDVDLLAVDDVQFFAGKKATLIEFQHTLDALARQGRQLVLSADRAPAELGHLGAELVTRLTGGLVCSLEAADYETRLGITRQFAAGMKLAIPDDVARLIAAETSGDARQIRGALHRLQATSEAREMPISLAMAQQALSDIFAASQRIVQLPDVERAVCEVFGIEQRSLRDGNKTKAISHPRMLAMWLARKYTRAAFSEIGEYFGRRSHSTVISAERKVSNWMARGAKLQLGRSSWPVDEAIRRIETKLRTG